MLLAGWARNRDNNFNLLRILAALTVLLNHSFPLLGYAEPCGQVLGMSVGTIAVDVFFITSGFLVSHSLLSRGDWIEYLGSRILRIYPALIAATLFSLLVVGLHFTSLSAVDFLLHRQTTRFLLSNITLVNGLEMNLPQVFPNRPFQALNGSLWTLVYEIKMYLLLLLAWLLFNQSKMAIRYSLSLKHGVLILSIVSGVFLISNALLGHAESHLSRFIFMFFSGATLSCWSEHINLTRRLALLLSALMFVAGCLGKTFLFPLYCWSVAYLVVFLAFVPAGKIRAYNRLGDYSYGIYIYAFPVQQALAASIPDISILHFALLATLATVPLAVFSWHWIEKPILDNKKRYLQYVKQGFSKVRGVVR